MLLTGPSWPTLGVVDMYRMRAVNVFKADQILLDLVLFSRNEIIEFHILYKRPYP